MKALHPVQSSDGKHLEIRAAIFNMTNKEKNIFCSVLKNAKFPYGSASYITRYVHDKAVACLSNNNILTNILTM